MLALPEKFMTRILLSYIRDQVESLEIKYVDMLRWKNENLF